VDKIRDAVLLEEDDVERKRAIRTERYKYITALSKEDAVCRECERVHGGMEELYDLKEDPEEKHNLIDEKESEAKTLKQELSNWVQLLESKRGKRSTRRIEKTRVDYSVEEEKLIAKKLKELGYM
jgi:arylsulfatase A-like enzyme